MQESEELWTVKIRIVNIIRKKRRTIVSLDFIWLGAGGYCKRGYCEKQFRRKKR